MKIESLQLTLNLQSFYSFVKLDKTEQVRLLKETGILLDFYNEKNTLTKVYYLQGFFVEVIISCNLDIAVELIPYKQGYKLASFTGSKGPAARKDPANFHLCMN